MSNHRQLSTIGVYLFITAMISILVIVFNLIRASDSDEPIPPIPLPQTQPQTPTLETTVEIVSYISMPQGERYWREVTEYKINGVRCVQINSKFGSGLSCDWPQVDQREQPKQGDGG